MSDCMDCVVLRGALESIKDHEAKRGPAIAREVLGRTNAGTDLWRRMRENAEVISAVARKQAEEAKQAEGRQRAKANDWAGRAHDLEGALSRLATSPSWERVLEEADLETYRNASGRLCFQRRLKKVTTPEDADAQMSMDVGGDR